MKKLILFGILISILLISGCSHGYNIKYADNTYECDFNTYNCVDFESWSEAQYVFRLCGGINDDVHHLDGDQDGLACESLR